MSAQEIPRPRERQGGGLMTCEHKCYDLVSDLAVRHRPSVLISRNKEHGEQISSVVRTGFSFADNSADQLLDLPQSSQISKMTRQRHCVRNKERACEPFGYLRSQCVHSVVDGRD